jgi:hypothetical protein
MPAGIASISFSKEETITLSGSNNGTGSGNAPAERTGPFLHGQVEIKTPKLQPQRSKQMADETFGGVNIGSVEPQTYGRIQPPRPSGFSGYQAQGRQRCGQRRGNGESGFSGFSVEAVEGQRFSGFSSRSGYSGYSGSGKAGSRLFGPRGSGPGGGNSGIAGIPVWTARFQPAVIQGSGIFKS